MCHNLMRSIILGSVPQSHRIVTHQFGTKFWKQVFWCLAFLISQWTRRYPLTLDSSCTRSTTPLQWHVISLDYPWWESSLMQPTKQKRHSHDNFIPPNTPPREMSTIMGNKKHCSMIYIKRPSVGRNPTKLIFTTPSHSEGIQQLSTKWRTRQRDLPLNREPLWKSQYSID
jgi:hypothetical protein